MKKPAAIKIKRATSKSIVIADRDESRGAVGWGHGRPAGWARLRMYVLARDGYVCRCHYCVESGDVRIATEVDHIDNRRLPGYDDADNLQAINAACHLRKTRLESQIAAGRKTRPQWMRRLTAEGVGDDAR